MHRFCSRFDCISGVSGGEVLVRLIGEVRRARAGKYTTAFVALAALGLASCSGPAAPEAAKPGPAVAASGPKEPEGDSSAKRLRLMTAEQYRNTLSYVFGPGIS